MVGLSSGWMVDVERGPDWLFVRLGSPLDGECDVSSMAESIWFVIKQHFVYRVVLECDQLPMLDSALLAQLIGLHRRLQKEGGVLRLCGLSDSNQEMLKACRLDGVFPQFRNRSQAVLAHRPARPR
jgi:anti-anti-sigma factor